MSVCQYCGHDLNFFSQSHEYGSTFAKETWSECSNPDCEGEKTPECIGFGCSLRPWEYGDNLIKVGRIYYCGDCFSKECAA